jgi:hypothetical protein
MSKKLCLATLFFAVSALPLLAQTTFGRIAGAVTDPTGASVPNAKVILRNVDTQATREMLTNERGYYSVENLPIGPYSVEVDHPGFKRTTQSGFAGGFHQRLQPYEFSGAFNDHNEQRIRHNFVRVSF